MPVFITETFPVELLHTTKTAYRYLIWTGKPYHKKRTIPWETRVYIPLDFGIPDLPEFKSAAAGHIYYHRIHRYEALYMLHYISKLIIICYPLDAILTYPTQSRVWWYDLDKKCWFMRTKVGKPWESTIKPFFDNEDDTWGIIGPWLCDNNLNNSQHKDTDSTAHQEAKKAIKFLF